MSDAPTGEPGSDEALMIAFVEGDSSAFDALFARYAKAVHAFLFRILRQANVAEDLTQATFLSVVRSRARFDRSMRFKPWLYAIASNAARDHLRRKREELTKEGELPSDLAADSPEPADPGLTRQVQQALNQLPEAQRQAILLHRFEGMSFAEIAESLGLTETAVKVRAHRGYERLRQLLASLKEDV